MSSMVVYGTAKTRITLYAADGVTAVSRITLQKETREGLELSFPPEGVTHELGSGSGWARRWGHRGFRPRLAISWDLGLQSSIETWSGSAWGAPDAILTPLALAKILNAAFVAPCLVEPHLDKDWSFLAQPDPDEAFTLKDIRGVMHNDLALTLVATTLTSIPDWALL